MGDSERVLLVQDTTSFNFSHHPASAGMGPLEHPSCRGFLAHTTLAVSGNGVPLGVLEQQVWTRLDSETGKRPQRHETAFADKESYKWVKGLPQGLPQADRPAPVVVCDAEAHIYECLDVMLNQSFDYVVRAADARAFTTEGQGLFAAVSDKVVQHRFVLPLNRRPDRAVREAHLELRFDPITLKRPKRAVTQRESLMLWVIDVCEPHPPDGENGVHWVLLTCLPLDTVADAFTVVQWYTSRWLVERFHYVLKSGCQLEHRQLREEKRLERLLAVFSLVAWRLLWLTYQARHRRPAT